jgi:hypothetical protein
MQKNKKLRSGISWRTYQLREALKIPFSNLVQLNFSNQTAIKSPNIGSFREINYPRFLIYTRSHITETLLKTYSSLLKI